MEAIATEVIGDADAAPSRPVTTAAMPDAVAPSEKGVAPPLHLQASELAQAIPTDGDATVWDPWERQNRRVYRFNTVVDDRVLRPLARAYTRVVPAPVRAGITRFLRNLGEPANAINGALQGDPGATFTALGRFAIDSTLGLGGIFDPATRIGLHGRDDEDFGQTLGTWGWLRSRYLVVPLLGPRTVRDTLSLAVDPWMSPLRLVGDRTAVAGLNALHAVDGRARLLPFDEARRDAFDDYRFVRDAWSQRRAYRIARDERPD